MLDGLAGHRLRYRGADPVRPPRVGACCRSSPCRTSRKAGTGHDRRDRRRARGACAPLDVHADADHNRSVFTSSAATTSSSRRSSRRSRSPATGSTSAGTRACTRGSARRTSCRRADRARRHGARAPRGLAVAGGSVTLGLPVFLYAPPERGPGVLPERRRRGAPAPLDAGELAPDFGPSRLDPVGRRGDRRRAAAADRVQRQPARHGRGRARDRGRRPRGRERRVPRRARARARAAAGRARAGVDERRGLAGRAAARDRRADRARGAAARRRGRRLASSSA